MLIGILMAITGLLGLPFSHGLIPQAPLHVLSLSTPVPVEEVFGDEPNLEAPMPIKYETPEQRFKFQSIHLYDRILYHSWPPLHPISNPSRSPQRVITIYGITSIWK